MLTLPLLNLFVDPDFIINFILIKVVGPGFPTTLRHIARQQLHQSHPAWLKLLCAWPGSTCHRLNTSKSC